MLFVKKKPGAPSTAAQPTGLFIDPAERPADAEVIDVEVRALDVTDTAPAPEAAVPPAPSASGGLKINRAAAKADQPAAATVDRNPLRALRERFKSSKPGAPGAADAADESATPPAKPELKAKAKVQPEKPAKPKAKPQPKSPKFSGKAERRVTLLTELDSGRQLFWALEGDKLEQLAEAPDGPVLSFSKEDFRFKAAASLSFKQASDLALQEVGEAVQVVNRSKDLRTVYATREERALESKFLLAPAQQVLDRVLVERRKQGKPLVCGFLFKDAASDVSLAVLYHLDTEGETSKPQISVNPDSMEFVVAQFSASRKVDKATTEVVLFDNAEFLAATAGVQPFPNEPVWRGVPVRKLLSGMAVASIIAGVLSAGHAAQQYQLLSSLQQKQARLTGDVAQAKKTMSNLVTGAVPGFARLMSLDPNALAQRAQALWTDGARLTLTADLKAARYELWMPVARPGTFNNRPTVVDPITAADHHKLVDFKVPEGCTREQLGISGGMNETQLAISCETGHPDLSRYRSD